MAESLLDFGQPLDLNLLEQAVVASGSALNNDQRTVADKLLQQFKEHPQAWTRVDQILENARHEETKYFGLQILESVVRFKWGALPVEQREGIKTYLSNLIIKYATDDALFRGQRRFLGKLNIVLVQILKQDWPLRWRSFIPDLVAASKSSENLCENSMAILRLLSEEVFDFSRGELTQVKIRELKQQLNDEFRLIHDLCLFVLTNTQKPELVKATLTALQSYLTWVPLGYIFQSNLMHILLHLFPQPHFRTVALQCLTEVGSLSMGPEFAGHFLQFYRVFMAALAGVLPLGTNIAKAYEAGSDEQQAFVQNLALFFTGFLKAHVSSLEASAEDQAGLLAGLAYLVDISAVDDTEVFKTCLDYWNFFVPEVYAAVCSTYDAAAFSFLPAAPPAAHPKRALYGPLLAKLRAVMITKMAKPEEVIVVEDESGNIVREAMKDVDVLAQYRAMREALIYLCHLDYEDTEAQMLERLRQQLAGAWTWGGLNTLCWAIGSISGSMAEEQENRFLVTVIRDLLNLCEITRGKDNKAVIASNIMYVVGQYPKFLRAHWKFLKTVVNKLFEFMHESHPGVQDMACDTFLKIVHKCKRKFVVLQISEHVPFISELLDGLPAIVQDLAPHQVHSFYESVGLMIGAESEAAKRDEFLSRLMRLPNAQWQSIIAAARASPESLRDSGVIKALQANLQTNVAVCSSLGHPFLTQMACIYPDMLQVYKLYSELISKAIAEGGPNVARSSMVKYMRSVKKAALRLIEAFVEKCEDTAGFAAQFVPAMMDPILGDYARNVPDARDSEVLSLFAAIIAKLKGAMEPEVPRIFEAVFECTLSMITRNFEDYPEHRLRFFALLHAITNHCFATLLTLSPAQLRLVIDSIVWAFRHTERNVAETGLALLLDLLTAFGRSGYATAFYVAYYRQLLQEIFAVMTDTFHKPGLKLHTKILHHLFQAASSAAIAAPLWDAAKEGAAAYPSNAAFLRAHLTTLLAASFPNMTAAQIEACVVGMVELAEPGAFKAHIRDFLVQTKQFASSDNAELFAEEVEAQRQKEKARLAAIPGMVNPNELPDAMADA